MRQLKILSQITNRNSPSLEKYFVEVNRSEMISADQEAILAQRIREGDQIALEKLTRANLRFVISVAKQYDRGGHGLTLGDLINEGNIGLIKAASKFDETRGFKFISYAVWWIRQSIMSAISQNSRMIRQPMNRVSSFNRVSRSFSDLEQELQREPTDSELAEALEMPEDQVTQIKRMGARPASIDAPLQAEEVFSLLDLLHSDDVPNPEAGLLDSSLKVDLNLALSKLTNRESEIVVLFFGLNNTPSMTLNDIGVRLELTRERVRQIKEVAIRKLQRSSSGNGLLKSYLN